MNEFEKYAFLKISRETLCKVDYVARIMSDDNYHVEVSEVVQGCTFDLYKIYSSSFIEGMVLDGCISDLSKIYSADFIEDMFLDVVAIQRVG